MSVALLDVNVLIAMFDVNHTYHQAAQDWMDQNRKYGWTTCPLTINGAVRILGSPTYFNPRMEPFQVVEMVRDFCAATDHHFWPDSVSLLDEALFHAPAIKGHQKITDAYLLGLAVRNHGRLATFDRAIPLKAVHGARASHLAIID